jgi:hypothetical protein
MIERNVCPSDSYGVWGDSSFQTSGATKTTALTVDP